jgi:branched-chain amino acid transport system substrate-binding protein
VTGASGWWVTRASLLAALLACVASVLAAGCASSKKQPFTIGILSDCYGFESGSNELNVASAELPLIERGAKRLGHEASDLVGPAAVAGRRVELVLRCVAGTNEVIPEARRLVEEDGAQAIVGPENPAEGMAMRRYARKRAETAFLIEPSAAPELTLMDAARNVFRFTLDAAQSNAGLGRYAYRQLGWRKAAVVGDDVPYAWAQAAGFVAEFCVLGGRIVDRIWIPLGIDPATVARQVPRDVDGVYVGQAVLPMAAFLKRYASLGHDLSRQAVASARVVADPGVIPVAKGVVVGGSPAVQWTQPERAYARAFARAFPGIPAQGALTGTSLAYYVGVEAALEALTRAHGASGRPFQDALAALRLDSPAGRIRLDRDRQAIGPNYLSRIAPGGIRTVRVVPGVEHTFGGYFTAARPPPSETSPGCVKRTPPPWAR